MEAVHDLDRRRHVVRLRAGHVEAGLDDAGEHQRCAAPRNRDDVVAFEQRAGIGERGLLDVAPQVRRALLLRRVEQHPVAGAGEHLVHPYGQVVAQMRCSPGVQQLQCGDHVQRAHVRRCGRIHRAEPAFQRHLGARIAEHDGGARHGVQRPRLPERAAGVRTDPGAVDRPVPVGDEVHPAPVGVLHRQHEVEQPLAPGAHPRQLRPLPHRTQQHDAARGIVNTGNAFHAGLARRDGCVVRARVHGERNGARPGRRQRVGQPGELPQHVSMSSTMSRTTKSAAPRTVSAAP